MRKGQGKKFLTAALILILVTVCFSPLLSFSPLEGLENSTWDLRLRAISGQLKPHPRIKIITIDQASLDYAAKELGTRWMWPRDMYEPVLRFLQDAGVAAVGFDILFTESTEHGYELDLEFAKTVGQSVPVISAVVLSNSSSYDVQEHSLLFEQRLKEQSKEYEITEERFFRLQNLPAFRGVTLPFPELVESSAYFGNVRGEADSDGIFRHVGIGGRWNGLPVLNLPFALAATATKEVSLFLQSVASVQGSDGRLAVQFIGPEQSFPTYSFAAVLTSFHQLSEGKEPNVNPADFKDSIVLIGMTAPGLKDLRPTPLAAEFPGVEFNATVLDNILNKRFVRKAPLWMNGGVLFLTSAAIAFSTLFLGTLKASLSVSLGTFLVLMAGAFFAAVQGCWIALFVPLLACAASLLLGLAAQYYFEGRQRLFLRGAFGHFVSPLVIDQIVANPDKLSLGGERRELTIFFSDIAGFTTLSESLPPDLLVKLLNEYLTLMTDTILSTGGTLDKYEGDAVIAFWNAPLAVDGHPEKGVLAALTCQRKLHATKEYFQETFGVFPNTRIGLNTGTVTVGNFGSHSRFDYTMIGDATNLAARLEGVNKVFGTNILFSEETAKRLSTSIPTRRIGSVRVVGKAKVVAVYEPLTPDLYPHHETQSVALFQEALTLFEQGRVEEALTIFQTLPQDPVAKNYQERIQEEGLLEKPGYDATWNLSSK